MSFHDVSSSEKWENWSQDPTINGRGSVDRHLQNIIAFQLSAISHRELFWKCGVYFRYPTQRPMIGTNSWSCNSPALHANFGLFEMPDCDKTTVSYRISILPANQSRPLHRSLFFGISKRVAFSFDACLRHSLGLQLAVNEETTVPS
jgi:hypothetical protein